MNRSVALEAVIVSRIPQTNQWLRDEIPAECGIGVACVPPIPISRENPKSRRTASYASLAAGLPRIAFKGKKRISLVQLREVFAVEVEGNNVVLHRAASSALLRESIATVDEKLADHGFIWIHRSVLVNMVHVDSVEVITSGGLPRAHG